MPAHMGEKLFFVACGMKNKEQHYVPKLFLRRFSMHNNEKTIGVFNIKSKHFTSRASIKSQACKPYFYGKDGRLEAALAALEGPSAEILRGISASLTIPASLSSKRETLIAFVVALAMRTPAAIDEMEKLSDKMRDLVFEGIDDAARNKVLPKLEPRMAMHLYMMQIASSMDCCTNLKAALLINKTNTPFITCDNPVIKYNQYLESRKEYGGITGYAQMGFQMFLPISPSTMLLFYDSWVYKAGNKNDSSFFLTNVKEIHSLNILSFLNCEKVVYFNHEVEKYYLEQLANQYTKYRIENKIGGERYYSYGRNGDSEEFGPLEKEKDGDVLLRVNIEAIRTNLNLSFLTLTKQAKRASPDEARQIRRGCKVPTHAHNRQPFRFELE